VLYSIPISPVVELREGAGGGSCGDSISMLMAPLMVPSSWATLHVIFVTFIDVRLVRRCWF
jgi:hypothetical protein